ncbi:MAG: ribokinase, partial [Stackebrandtia sp.]
MIDIAVVGSINMDLLAVTPRLPRPGETILAGDFRTIAGGKGANQATAAARAGRACAMIGAVGDDAFGDRLRNRLRSHGVNVSGVRKAAGSSGVAMVTVDSDGENHIVVAPGANATVTALTALDRATIAAADTVVCQLEVPLTVVAETARTATKSGTRLLLIAAPAQPLPDELLSHVDVLVVNAIEAATLTGSDSKDPVSLVRTLGREVSHVALTIGDGGCWFTGPDIAPTHIAAPDVTAVDTTGAGDAFTGALAARWSPDPLNAVRWA